MSRPAVDQAQERLDPVFAQIRATAAGRDAAGELDQKAINALRDSGFTALRVPVEYGGSGLSFQEASWFLTQLAEADSNLAQALRPHVLNLEDVLSRNTSEPGQAEHVDRWLKRIGQGAVVGNALTERGNVRGETMTKLSQTGTDAQGQPKYVLNGTKFYSTGAAYADWILVSAVNEDGEPVSLAVDAEATGIQVIDDWDGFGQQLTASGTTVFTDTPVAPEEVSPPGEGLDSGARVAFGQSLAQYVHLATLLGIGEALLRDGSEYIRGRTRGFSHGAAQIPADDPQVLQVVGEVSSDLFAARVSFGAVLEELARQLQADADGVQIAESDVDQLYLSVYQAQQVIAKNVLGIATKIFEVGGASLTAESRAVDRHWRNARVLASHNPLIYRARIIGDWEVNGTAVERSYTVGTPG